MMLYGIYRECGYLDLVALADVSLVLHAHFSAKVK